MKWKQAPYLCVVMVGFLQIMGMSIPGLSPLRSLGLATTAAPLPLVFSHFRGLETFSSVFTVRVFDISGSVIEQKLDPKSYGKLTGPYNRRNVYGAVVAYGPKLVEENEKKLVQNVLAFGFCQNGPLAQTLGLNSSISKAEILVANSVTPLQSTLEVSCP